MLPSTLATATHRLLQVGLDRDSNKASEEIPLPTDAPRKTIKPPSIGDFNVLRDSILLGVG
jgi:hypothetical protein